MSALNPYTLKIRPPTYPLDSTLFHRKRTKYIQLLRRPRVIWHRTDSSILSSFIYLFIFCYYLIADVILFVFYAILSRPCQSSKSVCTITLDLCIEYSTAVRVVHGYRIELYISTTDCMITIIIILPLLSLGGGCHWNACARVYRQ